MQRTMEVALSCWVVALTFFLGAPAQALESLAPYDDFNAKILDPDRWLGVQEGSHVLEAVRQVQSKRLDLAIRAYGDTNSNSGRHRNIVSLRFADPGSVTAIEAKVMVTSFEVKACPSQSAETLAIARLSGDFFNVLTTIPGSALNDVFAVIDVLRSSASPDSSNTLQVRGTVFLCTNPACLATTDLGSVDLGTVKKGKPVKLFMQWDPDNDRFIFRRDNEPEEFLEYVVSDAASPGRPVQQLSIHTFVANCTTPGPVASMEALFDDVSVNESAAP